MAPRWPLFSFTAYLGARRGPVPQGVVGADIALLFTVLPVDRQCPANASTLPQDHSLIRIHGRCRVFFFAVYQLFIGPIDLRLQAR